MTKIPKLLIQFHNTFKSFNHNPKIVFSIILVLSITFLFPNSFSISYLLATSQKHIGHHDAITTVGEPTKFQKSHDNASKQCLENHGIKSPNIFAVVHGDAWNNPLVIDTISKYYEYADNGFANSMFLHCDGYDSKQTDCRTYTVDDELTYANRYSIREESHNSWDQSYLHNDQIIFQKFVGEVNSGINFNNKKGTVDAIPIIAYHSIDNNGDPYSTDVNLFEAEMKYLHDNGFKVIPMSDLGYDEGTKSMYIKQ
jgi:hypothetical protein